MLDVSVLRGLSHRVQEVDPRKVFVGDFEHVFRQSLGGALAQGDIGDLERDEAWDDVDRHPNVADIRDPVGGVQDESVVHSAGLHLHVLDVPAVHVLLGERLDRRLFGSDVALVDKMPEKAMRRADSDCEHDLRWQVVLVSDLHGLENIFNLKCPMCH